MEVMTLTLICVLLIISSLLCACSEKSELIQNDVDQDVRVASNDDPSDLQPVFVEVDKQSITATNISNPAQKAEQIRSVLTQNG